MIDRVQISALIVVPLASVAVSLWAAGEPLSWIWLSSFGGAVSATAMALLAFDRWVWRWRLLQGWIVKRPILIGSWRLTIKSLWVDPETKRRPDAIEATATIRQTYTRLHFRFQTAESAGDLIAEKIIQKDDGTYQVFGVYRNQPKISVQDRSRTHLGAMLLDVVGDPAQPEKLVGQYWTDRGTFGEVEGTFLR